MNEQQIDELFKGKLAQEQVFHQSERQWKVVKAGITSSKRRYFLWVAILFMIVGTSTIATLYFGNDSTPLSSQVVTPQLSTSDISENTTNSTAGTPDSNVSTSDSVDGGIAVPTVNSVGSTIVKLGAESDNTSNTSSTNFTNSANSANTANTANTAISIQYSPTSNLAAEVFSLPDSPVRNANYNYISTPANTNIKRFTSSTYSSYGAVANNSDQDSQEIISNHDFIPRLGLLPVIADAKNQTAGSYHVPLYSPTLHPRRIQKKFMIFTGLSYSFTQNSDLQLIKPTSFKLGGAYSPIKVLSLRMAYQYDPFDIQVNSNFDAYDIKPQGAYEPQTRESTNIRGRSHVLCLGLAVNINLGNWGIYPMLHTNMQYLTNTVEASTFLTNYGRIETVDEIVNQSSISTFSGGLGLQYNFATTAFSVEYEYYVPFNSLYGWTDIQNISFLVQYKF